jgi:hypothetical protein
LKDKTRASKKQKKGCMIALLLALAFLSYAVWSAGEQGRRARRAHQAIQPGMSCWNVEALLTGRHYCHFQISTNDQWETRSKADFKRFLETLPTNTSAKARLQLHFLGTTPSRVTFFVYLDNKGMVTNLSKPYGWD